MKKYTYFCLVFVLIIVSCNNSTKQRLTISNNSSHIDSITALFFNYDLDGVRNIRCDELQKNIPNFEVKTDEYKEGILDALITDSNVLKEIQYELSKTKPLKDKIYLDTRIAFKVYYKNGSVDNLCTNGKLFFLNDVPLQKNNRLMYILKNNIGYYSWFGGLSQKYMDELKDTTFTKEPFIESPYYKLYKENNKKRRQTHD